jgi:hypothetical protein
MHSQGQGISMYAQSYAVGPRTSENKNKCPCFVLIAKFLSMVTVFHGSNRNPLTVFGEHPYSDTFRFW